MWPRNWCFYLHTNKSFQFHCIGHMICEQQHAIISNFCLYQSEKNPPVKTKRPSRKYRRRPRNLLEEYSRRSRKHSWLETHVWHAKRFKMVEQWGYKIPLHPCDKGVRSAYRSTAKYCLIQV